LSTITHNETAAHEIANTRFGSTPGTTFHAEAPPVGLVDVITAPSDETTTQRCTDGQETDVGPFKEGLGSTVERVQADAPPAGSVDVAIIPIGSTATQRFDDGQEVAEKATGSVPVQPTHDAEPPAGSVEVMMLVSLVPMHKVVLSQLRESHGSAACATAVGFHADAPPVGSVETTTSLSLSPATHSELLGQAIVFRKLPPGGSNPVVAAQSDEPPVGLVEVKTSPPLSTAAQSVAGVTVQEMGQSDGGMPKVAGVLSGTAISVHAGAPPVGSEVLTIPP
jgi:hypothetical protein